MKLSKSELIEQELTRDIYSGRYSDKLPSEIELAKLYKTTPVTAGKTLNRLKEKNIVHRIGGRGTFVNRDFQNKARIHLNLPKNIVDDIKPELKKSFPEIEIEISNAPLSAETVFNDFDIVSRTSYFPAPYDKYFAPLPTRIMLKYLNNEDFFSDAFNIHRHNRAFYGLPHVISPSLPIYNKKLLKQYCDIDSVYDIEIEDLMKIYEKTKHTDICLFDLNSLPKGSLLAFIFAQLDDIETNRNNMRGFCWERIEKGLKTFWQLYEKSIKHKADFSAGKTILGHACRQSLSKKYIKEANFSWDIMPALYGKKRLTLAASESLCVCAKAKNKELLFKICEAFLSQEIQNIFGKHKHGIPILKSAALKSMDSRRCRDDIFFNELENTVYNYEIFDKPLMNSFISSINELFAGKIDFSKFIKHAQNMHNMNKENNTARELLINEDEF